MKNSSLLIAGVFILASCAGSSGTSPTGANAPQPTHAPQRAEQSPTTPEPATPAPAASEPQLPVAHQSPDGMKYRIKRDEVGRVILTNQSANLALEGAPLHFAEIAAERGAKVADSLVLKTLAADISLQYEQSAYEKMGFELIFNSQNEAFYYNSTDYSVQTDGFSNFCFFTSNPKSIFNGMTGKFDDLTNCSSDGFASIEFVTNEKAADGPVYE